MAARSFLAFRWELVIILGAFQAKGGCFMNRWQIRVNLGNGGAGRRRAVGTTPIYNPSLVNGPFVYGAFGRERRIEGAPPADAGEEMREQFDHLFQGMAYDPAIDKYNMGHRD